MIKKYLLLAFLFYGFMGFSQQLSYKPLNPAFGGDSFNYNWLMSSATAQNKLTAPRTAAEQQSELSRFGENLNRQILSQISRVLLQQQIQGVGNFDSEGIFTFGTLNVEVYETSEGLVINILDTATGEETQVIVPN